MTTASAAPADVDSPAPSGPSVPPSISPATGPPVSAVALRLDWIAETIVDRLRMRSLPSTGLASERYEPLLRTGTRLFVVLGPVEGSGYNWYEVIHLGAGDAPARSGWVAVASREGERWVRDATLSCPDRGSLFENFAGLANLGGAAGLACFGHNELSFLAHVASCACTTSGPAVEPRWLASEDRTTYRLTAPDWLEAADREIVPAFDPDIFDDPGLSEPDLPEGDYQVTAHYDDLAAASCTIDRDVGGDPKALVGACRMTLVITRIELFQGVDPG